MSQKIECLYVIIHEVQCLLFKLREVQILAKSSKTCVVFCLIEFEDRR